jgi:hypothetical protein
MVYAHRVARVTLSGTMFQGQEVWSTGFFLGQEGADAGDPSQAAVDAIRDLWVAFFTNSTSRISSNYQFTQAKIAAVGANGFTEKENVVYSYPAATTVGGVSTETLPPQCALVLTLLSDRPRGKAAKGRMYLPGIASSPGTNGKISTTVATGVATNAKTFFDGVRANFNMPGLPILAAKGSGAFAAMNAQNDFIQTIRVGDVIDTQRRRRNGLTEVYTSRTLT